MAHSTGRQRNYAIAMGIIPRADCAGEKLSEMMSFVKKNLSGKPNEVQIRLARKWGIALPENCTGWQAVDELYAFVQARVFVYSVVRRMQSQKWQRYSDNGLDDSIVCAIAKGLIQDADRRAEAMEMENTLSGTKGDAWYRFGSRQFESNSVRYVQDAIGTKLSEPAERRMKDSSRVIVETDEAPIAAEVFVQSPTDIRTRPRVTQKSGGCLVVLASLTAIIIIRQFL